jgi:two-component system cell cycle response regulator DivK
MANDDESRPGEPRGKLLYIEDNPINMAFVEALLEDMAGVSLVKATTGTEGVQLARAERPDLVLLDMHLPDVGGLEVVRTLNVEIAGGLRVVILTADHLSMDVIKAMSLGACEYWVKPIDGKRLRDGVTRYLRPPKRASQS